MEDIRNRNLGEIYTPNHLSKLLFDLTNKYVPNFNKTHTVWDNCWGTGNLTKDFDFDDLYASTLRMQDIKRHISKNPGSKKFTYNFLEEDIEQLMSIQAMWTQPHKIPEELVEKLNGNQPFIFYINPPYIGTGVFGTNNTDFKEDATINKVKEIMREASMGSACDQTFCQFLYKIMLMKQAYENKNISIAIICPPIYLTAGTYSNFRKVFLKEFKFMGGVFFKASEFEGLSNAWGITMQIWTPGETEDKKNFKFDLYERDETGEFRSFGKKTLYNLDGEITCVDWLKERIANIPQIPAPITLSSGCNISNKKLINTVQDALGYFYYKGNNIYHNEMECGILSAPYSNGGGTPICKQNFDDVVATMTARRAFSRYGANWTNDKDEYAKPDTTSETYKQLVANGYIYVLFNGSSNMSSLILDTDQGHFEYPNHFHFIGIDKMKEWLNAVGLELTGPGKIENRYMYYKIQEAFKSGLLLPKAHEVYNRAVEVWKDTIKLRAEFNEKEPNYQVLHWDASFYQIKQVFKYKDNKEFLEFNALYKSFEESLRPLVYACGYLR